MLLYSWICRTCFYSSWDKNHHWGNMWNTPFPKIITCFHTQKLYKDRTIFLRFFFDWPDFVRLGRVWTGFWMCVLFNTCRRLFLCWSQIDSQQIGRQTASPMSPEMVTILFLSAGDVFSFQLLVVLLFRVGRYYGFSFDFDSTYDELE